MTTIKTLLDYLDAVTPVVNDKQRQHIESLINDMVGNAEQVQYMKGWKDGLDKGRKIEKAMWSGWAPDDLRELVEREENENS